MGKKCMAIVGSFQEDLAHSETSEESVERSVRVD
jgi:hypothetical protein